MLYTASSITANRVSPATRYLPVASRSPIIHPTATVRASQITGHVLIDAGAHVVNAILRADEGTPFYIGPFSNVQDMVVMHAHSTQELGKPNFKNLITVPSKGNFAIYIGEKTSLAHGALIHGPAYIGDNTFIGFKSTIDNALIGNHVEIGPHAYIKNVTVPDNVAIAPGAIVTDAASLRYNIVPHQELNEEVAKINSELALAYFACPAVHID
jgi:carbonic anhydrase/acetyltransferase-like protein (isoleucine patch superfamily)